MTTGAKIGIGTKIGYETTAGASPLAFTEIAQVLDFPYPAGPNDFVETTNQDSTGRTKEYIAGLSDAQSFSFDCNYLPNDTSQTNVRAMKATGEARIWQIRESTSSPEVTGQFTGIVEDFVPNAPVADKRTVTITVRRSGPITWA